MGIASGGGGGEGKREEEGRREGLTNVTAAERWLEVIELKSGSRVKTKMGLSESIARSV